MLCHWGSEIKKRVYEMNLYGKLFTVKLKADVSSVSPSSELNLFLSFASKTTFHNEEALRFLNHSLSTITCVIQDS